jgi:hypothetical protein
VIDVRTADPNEPRPGTYAVFDAGTVSFDLTDAGLVLVDVAAAAGWNAVIDQQTATEIDIDFTAPGREASFEVEWNGTVLEIELDDERRNAEPGTFPLGQAGTATISSDGTTVTLDDLQVNDGWSVIEADGTGGDVDVELRRGGEVWEFDADIELGQLEVQIDFEVEGVPAS